MRHTVRFLPEKRIWRGQETVPLGVAAAEAGILLEQPCGGKGICGRCRVRADVAPDPADVRVLGAEEVEAGWRLGCRMTAEGDVSVEVPPGTRTVAHKSFGDDGLFRDIEPAYPGGWGVALDVGSTTLAAALVALDTGAVAASASTLNPQTHFGGDVMSRIAFAREREEGGETLRRVLATALDALTGSCLETARVGRDEVAGVVVVGNPTMTHSLLGLDLRGLGVAPYQGVRYDAWTGTARELGLELPAAEAHVLPGVRSHVGADAVAAVVAAGLDRAEAPTLLIDLGTNSEVVLSAPEGLLCTSASAGPAFEGATIHHGMRAVPGAIERLQVAADGTARVETVGGEAPVGLCGSGLIDAVAELVRVGVVEVSGRVRTPDELEGWCAADLCRSVQAAPDAGRAVRLAGRGDRAVLLTARDIRELQLVKGSIAAAVSLLLGEAGLEAESLDEVLIAGAFGSHIHVASARAIGLVPPLASGRVRPVGNAAGAGARLALVDRRARQRVEEAAARASFVELAERPDYQVAFVEALPFPESGQGQAQAQARGDGA